ncbi:ExbD/TolR family protein [Marichromatium bheemlicum]|uniref:Biopolymer transporter ExbD n=1 Tax=Marichromatium bheemlicum TaxID=365339 RepID=A0ABX1I5Q2_9GAMM|nr:biopolymer transporter ExbD [Marichromatium bheemlicum]NKN32792.1 biopolymer transporter ExbD [Marichromatium bheemlicum]
MRFTRPQPRPSSDDQLIPLINVIFLMLIFFMLAGHIAPSDPIEIEPPRSSEAPEAQPPQPEQRTLLIATDGRLALDGNALSPPQLQRRLAAWREAVPTGTLRIKADARLSAGQLQETLTLLRELGIEHITLLATQAR